MKIARDLNDELIIAYLEDYGDSASVKKFIVSIKGCLLLDASSSNIVVNDADRYIKFENLSKQSNELVRIFDRDWGSNKKIYSTINLEVYTLITNEIYKLRKIKCIKDNKNADDLSLSYSELMPLGYLENFLNLFREFNLAVNSATEMFKPKRGNSATRNHSAKRIKNIAIFFVDAFNINFKKLPPLTENGKVMDVFNEIVYAAGIKSENNFHHLRSAIKSRLSTEKSVQSS